MQVCLVAQNGDTRETVQRWMIASLDRMAEELLAVDELEGEQLERLLDEARAAAQRNDPGADEAEAESAGEGEAEPPERSAGP